MPDYVRTLLNTPLIVYSGQNDAQMQSALVMQEAFEQESATATPMPVRVSLLTIQHANCERQSVFTQPLRCRCTDST